MKYKARYSIGEVSRICNISKKALRYYDEIGLIPTQRKDYNNYRYYSFETLLSVPIIKYYKQMGFTLDEMRNVIDGDLPQVYRVIQKSFLAKIAELETEREAIHRKYISVKDWYNLLQEAEQVIENALQEVSVKYVDASEMIFLEQRYDGNMMASIINITFTNFLESIHNEITGPVIIKFSSHKHRIENSEQDIVILQKPLLPCDPEHLYLFGGHAMVSCYHLGTHDTIAETYAKILQWSQRHGYTLAPESFERYVTDYWTTKNNAQFVTEVMIKAWRKEVDSQPTVATSKK